MHPFYGPSARLLAGRGASTSGLLSMTAYLAFWAVALALVKREVDARFPKGASFPRTPDTAMTMLRERFARGEIDLAQFRSMAAVLQQTAPDPE